ncbi:terpene synthase family protein [Streptomyces sp. NPDC002845]
MTADPLSCYRRQLAGPEEHRLADALLDWALTHCRCSRGTAWHAKRAFYAATFTACCRPPDTVWWETLLAGKFNIFYFNVDDGPADELTQLTAQLHSQSHTTAGELGMLYRALLADMRGRQLPTVQLQADIATLCAAADAEDQQDITIMTGEQFHTLRLATIAALPFITCWGAIRGLPLTSEQNLVEAAAEAIYLANDLASLDKDCGPDAPCATATSNYVLFHTARVTGGLPSAVETATARYNHLIASLAKHTGASAAALVSIVDGNLDAHLRLAATRFPGAAHRLRQLSRIQPDGPAHHPAALNNGAKTP